MSLLENKCFINLIKFSSEWHWVYLSVRSPFGGQQVLSTLTHTVTKMSGRNGHEETDQRTWNRCWSFRNTVCDVWMWMWMCGKCYSTGTPNSEHTFILLLLYVDISTNWSVWPHHRCYRRGCGCRRRRHCHRRHGHRTTYIQCVHIFLFVVHTIQSCRGRCAMMNGYTTISFTLGNLFLSVSFSLLFIVDFLHSSSSSIGDAVVGAFTQWVSVWFHCLEVVVRLGKWIDSVALPRSHIGNWLWNDVLCLDASLSAWRRWRRWRYSAFLNT